MGPLIALRERQAAQTPRGFKSVLMDFPRRIPVRRCTHAVQTARHAV